MEEFRLSAGRNWLTAWGRVLAEAALGAYGDAWPDDLGRAAHQRRWTLEQLEVKHEAHKRLEDEFKALGAKL